MINIVIFNKKRHGYCIGFEMKGHAGFGEVGQDIVCASVSVLAINTVNSIEKFTNDKFACKANNNGGFLKFKIKGMPCEETKLLLKSMILGLTEIVKEYGDEYIKLIFKEV